MRQGRYPFRSLRGRPILSPPVSTTLEAENMIENIIKILEIPEVTGLVIVTFAAALKLSKKYFDSLLDERSKTLKWILGFGVGPR